MNIISVRYCSCSKYLLFIIITIFLNLLNICKCFASVDQYYSLTPKVINNSNVDSLKPSLKYLHSLNKSIIDWTTSLPILGLTNSARTSGAKSCLDDNMHTYYNSELDPEVIGLIKHYF